MKRTIKVGTKVITPIDLITYDPYNFIKNPTITSGSIGEVYNFAYRKFDDGKEWMMIAIKFDNGKYVTTDKQCPIENFIVVDESQNTNESWKTDNNKE